MLAEALVLEVTHRFQARTIALAAAVGAVLQEAWHDLPAYDEIDIPTYVARTEPTVKAAKSTSMSLASGFYSTIAQLRPPSLRPDMIATEFDTRQPFISHWRALKMGRPWEEAVAAGADGADAAAGDLVIATARLTGDAVYDATGTKIVGWRRVLDAGACDWCQLVATQRYHTAESANFGHRNCHCTAVPIFGESDPGRVINREGLNRIKAGGNIAPAAPAPAAPPVFAPHPDSRDAREIIRYGGKKAEQQFGPTMERLAKIHGAPRDGLAPTEIKAGGKATAKGGHFSPGKRPPKPKRVRGEDYQTYLTKIDAWRQKPLQPEIRVNDRGDGTGLLSFLHEYGHRLDFIPGGPGREAYGNFATGGSSSAAIRDFVSAAQDTPTIRNSLSRFKDFGYVQYFKNPVEIWARAYSQWAAQQLGGPELAALRASQTKNGGGYQWPDDEFEALIPLVESVLRERGILA